MENKINEYQLSKTLRFGLTLKKKEKKEGFQGDIYESHSKLKNLVVSSQQKIMQEVSANQESAMEFFLDAIQKCLYDMDKFISDWKYIYSRTDQIAVDKDFYKKLSKKIGFEAFWYEEYRKTGNRIKKPQERTISLSSLDKKDKFGKERKEYIVEYWQNNLRATREKYAVTDEKVKQFKLALDINRTDNRPNEVELRKLFLSLANVVKDVLEPLCNGSICFPNIEKLTDNDENYHLRNFATNYRFKSDLLSQIVNLQKYFEKNGGNVLFCRATLNPLTAIKNPKSTDTSIKDEINTLGLNTLLKNYQNAIYLDADLGNIENKLAEITNSKESLIKRGLLFKYKSIPAIVQRKIANFLSKTLNKDEHELYEFLRDIGQTKSPVKDYADLQNKEDFSIHNYPLKVAFDYAWESLAKNKYHSDIDFPKEACEEFLKSIFRVDISDENFKLYAQLLELRGLLATLEHNRPNNEQEFIEKTRKVLAQIDWSKFGEEKKGQQYKSDIEKWLESRNKEGWVKNENYNFKRAKQQIGLFRGGLKKKTGEKKEWDCLKKKNDVKSPKLTTYDALSQIYKDVAMRSGKTFATMRDKITGAAELNKISHYAVIIEDRNTDKYLLLKPIEKEKPNLPNELGGELTTYSVNSVTSVAIGKMIRKIRTDELQKNENKHPQRIEISDEEKEAKILKDWKDFIRGKKWDNDFGLDLGNKNLEQLKKEVDSKCYELQKRSISKKSLEVLISEGNSFLFPIVTKDLGKEVKTEKNQFTKDWNAVFAQSTAWRLTPEFRISYRNPTPNYPKSDIGDKRYSRFQMTAHFLCDFIPQSNDYISNREQIEIFKDTEKQKDFVSKFNRELLPISQEEQNQQDIAALMMKFNTFNLKEKQKTVKEKQKTNEKFYVFGIDRGQKELATLCVIDQDEKIIGDFPIYTRSFNSQTKQWEHKFLENRHILDLSNLRVETTLVIDNKDEKKKVLVDLSEVKVKDKDGNYTQTNKMQIKMQQLAYIRKLQFQMQTNPEGILDWLANNPNREDKLNNLVDKETGEKGLVSFYGSLVGELKDILPIEKIEEMLSKFKELKEKEKEGENVKSELDELVQLEPVDNLKYGVVANMIGVVAYLLEKFKYQAYISLEDLSNPFSGIVTDGTTGIANKAIKGEGKRADVEKYAGLGLYNFFEMQLLKKLFRIQSESKNILHLVPAFRAVKNYENIIAGRDKIKNQFGIVYFVDATSTSKMCPICNSTPDKNGKTGKKKKSDENVFVERDKTNNNDIIRCFVCGFDTTKKYEENPLKYIKSGDDNAAYIISKFGIKAYKLAKTVVIEVNDYNSKK
jgi:DNA-directed RNA polymerase subunit N (RpoN/RPB10)